MKRYIPKQIIIETTSACDLKCKLCPSLSPDHKMAHMDWDYFAYIIKQAHKENLHQKGTVIIPWMNGEPLLNPEFKYMVPMISKHFFRQYLTTNATHFDDELYDYIFNNPESTIYQVIVSLDGVPFDFSRSIEIARPGTNRTKVLIHINSLLEYRRKAKNKVDLAIKICKRGQDNLEIEEYIKYWLSMGMDYVCVGAPLTGENEVSMRTSNCQYFHNNFMVIRQDGRVTLCAYNERAANQYEGSPGTLKVGDGIVDFYNNDVYTAFRLAQENGDYLPPCDVCTHAYSGYGMEGMVEFRQESYDIKDEVYFKQDYYNQFYSLTPFSKGDSYYQIGGNQ